jgi:prevent-host-death family protein
VCVDGPLRRSPKSAKGRVRPVRNPISLLTPLQLAKEDSHYGRLQIGCSSSKRSPHVERRVFRDLSSNRILSFRMILPANPAFSQITLIPENPILTMVVDHGITTIMKEVAISVFKAKCLGILEEVRKTRKPIRVTRFGKPVAEVVPPSPAKPMGRRLGSMIGTGKILGDIVGPTGSWDDWEASR